MINQHRLREIRRSSKIVFRSNFTKLGFLIILSFLVLAIFAPYIAPHNPDERVTTDEGSWVTNQPPSLEYPLGVDARAYPIFSQVLYGTRIAFIVGIITAFFVGIIGSTIGVIAGYSGGWVESILMRVTDLAYGIPFIPLAIVLLMITGGGSLRNIILVISLVMWRNTARVIRSEVLTIKEMQMVTAAKASGAGDGRIILHHILPRLLPTILLFAVFATGFAVLAEAGLSFIGLGDASVHSWGQILNNAYFADAMQLELWYWILPPGVCISLFVIALYSINLGVEELVNPKLREPK